MLLESFWIIKELDKEAYSLVRKAQSRFPEYRRFINEQLGWKLIINEKLVKLEKTPAFAEPFMGISEFESIMDYCVFCSLLIYLEDREDEEQFLLSEMIPAVEMQLKDLIEVDWTKFTHRKSLIRVLKFAEKMHLLVAYEGSSDKVEDNIATEILYENTGLSRYFATNFTEDISSYTCYQDFENKVADDIDSNRGLFRINRVYKQLMASPAMYWERTDDADYAYLKNQRQWVSKYLNQFLGGVLHIHRNGAFLVLEDDEKFALYYPRENMISDISLLVCALARSKVLQGEYKKEENDYVILEKNQWTDLLEECSNCYKDLWNKEFSEKPLDKFLNEVSDFMESWLLIKKCMNSVILLPAIGKIIGMYPKDCGKKVETNE